MDRRNSEMSMAAEKLSQEQTIITLQSLTLKNFKGLDKFYFAPNGKDMNLFGDNGTGKTTVYDAFLWLFFDKDSSNRKTFNVKTLDGNGEALHGLDHTVEAVVLKNGKPITLRKTMAEKWTKKKGEATKLFTGHETNYWIDEVPVKAGEYQNAIKQILDEGTFKLITNPLYFNTQLSWQDRRKLIMEISGDVSDAAVIASSDKLSNLTAVLNGKSTDDYKKILNERIKKLNEEIAKIPIRIDELNSTLAGEEVDYTEIEQSIAWSKDCLAHLEEELVSASAISNEYRAKQNNLTILYQKQNQKRTELSKAANAEYDKLMADANQLQRQINTLTADIEGSEGIILAAEEMIAANNTKANDLRKQWQDVNAEVFVSPDDSAIACPTCGQGLPCDQKESIILKAKTKFDANKKAILESISCSGKTLVTASAKHQVKINDHAKLIADKKVHLDMVKDGFEATKTKLDAPRETVSVENHPEYIAIQAEIDALLADLQKPTEDVTTELLTKKRAITADIERFNSLLNNKDVLAKTMARIKELMSQERELADQIAELEGHKFLIEEFVKAKVNLLEDSINSRFQSVRFKLFDLQINGGISECCEALVNTNGAWVPYADGNNGGKINAGLDIINTLIKFYGIAAPVFVDNKESVTKLFPIQTQVIGLIVSEPDKILRVEGM